MAYLDDLLSADERVLVYGHQHGIVLATRLLGRLFSLLLLLAIMLAVQSPWLGQLLSQLPGFRTAEALALVQPLARYVQIGCLLLMVLVVLGALFDYLGWNARSYVLTSRRIISLAGVINKRSIDSSLEKINDVQLAQSWLGRMLDYGDLEILTASEQGFNSLQKIAQPLDFKRAMQEARLGREREQQKREYTPPAATVRAEGDNGVAQALHSLALLRDQNLLTPEEFEAKKRELLRRL
jgi:uncharacterized membrane protein YdbT with pleckstrin-like domain